MAKFSKRIVTPKVHTVGRLDGSEEKEAITPERIKSWADNTNQLIEWGIQIPAPYTHQDKNHRFVFPVIKGKDGETLADAYSGGNTQIPPAWDLAAVNTGFWDKFGVDTDGTLTGEVDADGDPNDFNTPAGKISKTIKQTSVLVMPPRTIRGKDGEDHQIGEHLAHVAVCLHGQEAGQTNFEPMASMPESLAMSFVLKMDEITGLPDPNKPKDEELYTVISLMRSALNVALPEDTSRDNFLQSLKLVLTQKLADQRESSQEDGVTQRPTDAVAKSPSIAMTQVVTPAAPNTVEAILMGTLIRDKKKALTERVSKLISTGRVGKDWAEKNLLTKIAGFSMSATEITKDGEFPKGLVEELIEGLEQATPLVGSIIEEAKPGANDVPLDGTVENMPVDVLTGSAAQDLSNADMDEILDSVNF